MRISILLCVQRKKNILMTEMIVIYVLPVEVAVFEKITKLWVCSFSGQINKQLETNQHSYIASNIVVGMMA